MLRWLGDLGFYVDQWYSVYAVLFFCFGLHLEAEPVCKTVALAFSVKEATGKKCLLIYELGDMCSQFLSLSDYPCYEISFLKGCFRYIIS